MHRLRAQCGISLVVKHEFSKLGSGVRFSHPAYERSELETVADSHPALRKESGMWRLVKNPLSTYIPHVSRISLLAQIVFVIVIVGGLVLLIERNGTSPAPPDTSASSGTAAAAIVTMRNDPPVRAVSPSAKGVVSSTTILKKASNKAKNAPASPAAPATPAVSASSNQVVRVENPYSGAPESFSTINDSSRAALVNILCMSMGTLKPISGSGILIDPRGVILTNAHVAQYVLLAQSPQVRLSCYIRSGSPAVTRSVPTVLYIPPVWVQKHASDLRTSRPVGTGEHDYALLLIDRSTDGTPLPPSFPFLSVDTREAIGFVDDQVLVASYPAEFLGSYAAQNELYSSGTITTIKQLLTFGVNSVDVISLGGVIQAQSGSSGGAVVNAWNRLIGLITTTSEGATTEDRDLHAITLSYISRDLAIQTKYDLSGILAGDVRAESQEFMVEIAPRLVELLLKQLNTQN